MFTGNGPRKARPGSSENGSTGSAKPAALRTTSLALAASIVFTAGWVPIDGFVAEETLSPIRTTSTVWSGPAALPTDPAATPIRIGAPEAPGTASGPVSAFGADAAEQADLIEAVSLYASAGLQLPALQVFFHDSRDDCNGHMGLFSKGGDKHRVDICDAYPAVIRHELAHAWEHHNMDDTTRRAFLDRIGVAEWNRQETPTRSRGIEQAADLVVWGIDSQPVQRMHRNFYADELADYELLTGSPSPRIAHWDDITPAATGETKRAGAGPIDVTPTAVFS